MTTRIYLDVDGVINAWHPKRGQPFPVEESGWKDWNAVDVGWSETVKHFFRGEEHDTGIERDYSYLIRYATELVDALNDIADLPDVEVVWLTTWGFRAVENLSPALGINGTSWRVLQRPEPSYADSWWKSILLRDDLKKSGTPDKIIWVDDDLLFFHDDAAPLLATISVGSEVLAVRPEQHIGLTSEDIRGIIDFINSEY